jgi:AhpD family alkylhydroperoxidase
MDERTKELIAIGASVGAHCQPCLTYHVEKARELGIDDEEIRAAIETGHMVEKGAMSAMRKFSAIILDTASSATVCKSSTDDTPPKTCCG